MNTIFELRTALAEYKHSPKARAVTDHPHLCPREDVMEYHYWRFIGGAYDDLAIKGWRFIMDQRQRTLDLTA